MKRIRKGFSAFLAFTLIFSLMPVFPAASAAGTRTVQETYINPVYRDLVDESDLRPLSPSPVGRAADAEYQTDIGKAGAVLREQLKKRQDSCTVYFETNSFDGSQDTVRAYMRDIAAAAEAHTGVPTEGDYLMWQYGGWNASTSYASSGSDYKFAITYSYTYYTTAEEEAKVDAKVKDVLKALNVTSASPYQKVKTIYDYICDNVTYDHVHLNNSSYKKQFTAYAALIDGTSVCQGYALLLYRLALELGVDCRLIPGISHGENHGWNILQLDGLYYNADTTWDAGNIAYTHFLKCPANFPDHKREADYDTSAFHKAYPMANSDYTPDAADNCSHSYTVTVVDATCTEDGSKTYTCGKCDDRYSETIPKLGHAYTASVTQPTCTEAGFTTHTCSRCGDTYTDSNAVAKGHSWDSGTVTKAPTQSESGTMEYKCAACPATRTETIPPLGTSECDHSYESKVTGPTCTEDGFTTHTCSKCNHSYTDSQTSAKGHSWDNGTVTKQPTQTQTGIREFMCSACDATKTESIPALGSSEAESSVYRIQGANRYETAYRTAEMLKTQMGVERFHCIVIASGTSFADALPGSYLANKKQAPILLVNQNRVQEVANYIEENAAPGATVYILGGEAVVPSSMDTLLKNNFNVERLAGKNRYATNLLILEEAGVGSEDLLVCTGLDFADSLSASALGRPILLVNKSLNDDQKAFLDALETNDIYIIGGTSAVSDSMEQALKNYSQGHVERISGSNRYDTSVKVAKTFFPGAVENLVLAYGHNFPDGLCGGVLAYFMNAPLILTRDRNVTVAADFANDTGVTTGAVLGGAGLISDDAVRQIFSMRSSQQIIVK